MPPQRKPAEITALAGSTRGKARLRDGVKIGYRVPDPPAHLSKEALVYWPYCAAQVEHLRCVTDSDAIQIGILSQSLSDYVREINTISEEGASILTDKGVPRTNPACNRRDQHHTHIQNCLDRLGLNPSNRSKVTELAPKLGVIEDMPTNKKSRYDDSGEE